MGLKRVYGYSDDGVGGRAWRCGIEKGVPNGGRRATTPELLGNRIRSHLIAVKMTSTVERRERNAPCAQRFIQNGMLRLQLNTQGAAGATMIDNVL